MGLADRLKDLKSKAEDAVVEHSDQIHSAVEKATTVADKRTGGKYRERIQKVGAKADDLVHSLKDTDAPEADAPEADAHEVGTQETGTRGTGAQAGAEGGEEAASS